MPAFHGIDVASNRAAVKYGRSEMLLRVLWGAFGRPLFRFVPRPFFSLRAAILRLFGASVGKNVHVYPSACVYMPWNLAIGDWSSIGERAYLYNLGPIAIGAGVTVSYRAHLCAGTHDFRQADFPLLKPPVNIRDGAWICTDAFVGPGVTVGEGAIVGARAVVVKDVPPRAIVAGNPAGILRFRPAGPDVE